MSAHAAASLDLLRRFAPGTPLRTATELILAQGTGALILIGSGSKVDAVTAGGFALDDVRFTAQRVAELAKMDGGIVVDPEAGRIVAANVHFMPDPSISTDETGTRFRTAERLARQTDATVLAVSEEGHLRAVVFSGAIRFTLQSMTELMALANQRLQSLERMRRQFDESVVRLDRHEVEGTVTTRDVVGVIQRAAVIRALGRSLDTLAAELGDAAALIALQAADLVAGVTEVADLVNADYQSRKPRKGSSIAQRVDRLDEDDLYDPEAVSDALGLGPLDVRAEPRGVRLLASVPRLPETVQTAILRRYRTFEDLTNADSKELATIDGVGKARAKSISRYLGGSTDDQLP